jgi:RNA polymerase sigma factor (TIGR02999 family)
LDMHPAGRQDVTRILEALRAGDGLAATDLMSLVYEELRRIAAFQMAREGTTATLQPTVLVHEAYLRLLGKAGSAVGTWENRSHFFFAAAEAMRRILIDRARERQSLKRGGGWRRLPLDPANLSVADAPAELIDLDRALGSLAAHDPTIAELVKLRFFAGLSHHDAAEILGISRSSADRQWAYARAWLFRYLQAEETAGS